MKKYSLIFLVLVAVLGSVNAQENLKFSVELSSDSVLLGNYLEVTFTLENAQGANFIAPEFDAFDVVGGPNTSSNFSMVNGVVNQSIAYSYFLKPRAIGNFYIQAASIEVDGKMIETLPLEVMALPNPDGIIQQPQRSNRREFRFDNFDFGPDSKQAIPQEKPKPKKKKRKTVKI